MHNVIRKSESFKCKVKTTSSTTADGNTENVEIAVPLKYLSNFWRALEKLLITYEINLILNWPSGYVISTATGAKKVKIRHTKLYVSVSTSSTQGHAND